MLYENFKINLFSTYFFIVSSIEKHIIPIVKPAIPIAELANVILRFNKSYAKFMLYSL